MCILSYKFDFQKQFLKVEEELIFNNDKTKFGQAEIKCFLRKM
jgi:hypothetical protein